MPSMRDGPAAPVFRWGRRHPRVALPLALVALLVLLGSIGALVGPPPTNTSTSTAGNSSSAAATTSAAPSGPALPAAAAPGASPASVSSPSSKSAEAGPLLVTGADGAVLPDRKLTPGEVFPAATEAQICVAGYSAGVRSVSDGVRHEVFADYNIDYALHAGYELDHLVPLELGGDNSVANLWPEPRQGSGSASVKDHLENNLHALVCAGQVPLLEARQAIEGDWWAANAKYSSAGTSSGQTYHLPASASEPAATDPPSSSPAGSGVYYPNCAAARAAGVAPLSSGQPGYRSGLDRDHDGTACE